MTKQITINELREVLTMQLEETKKEKSYNEKHNQALSAHFNDGMICQTQVILDLLGNTQTDSTPKEALTNYPNN